ncbi:MAG: HD domain-containing phosphohydrolase [Thermomicrobiales bacterium]
MSELRLAEMIAALSQTADLGMGQQPETALRICLLATGLARSVDLSDGEVQDIYYAALLQHIGCTAYAHETARAFGGDDVMLRSAGATIDSSNPGEILPFLLTGIGKGASPGVRARAVVHAIRLGSSFDRDLSAANCEAALSLAGRLGMDMSVREALGSIYERWDGKGYPRRLEGEDVPQAARFVQVATQAELFYQMGGMQLALDRVRQRSGASLDPQIADAFLRQGPALLAEIGSLDVAVAVLDAEPAPTHLVPDSGIDDVAGAFADMTDLKSPFMLGHAAGVSRLAERAALHCGLPPADVTRIRRAALLQDIGRIGIPNGIWDKPGPLTSIEWERVRLHPYHSERILSRSQPLASLAPLAGMHHERLDGSGYYRQVAADTIPIGARLLAAADAYHAMTQRRAHRNARSPDQSAAELSTMARAGLLDPEATRAVLEAAGHSPAPIRSAWPAGLTDREVEVLRLAIRGLSNRQIGDTLSISPKTAGHHIQHIYDKIDVSTRAGAAIFAMQHDLVHPGEK